MPYQNKEIYDKYQKMEYYKNKTRSVVTDL